ncbi:transposable element Tc1 transposase [Trichonephila clavipes]|nr:transposable element Tc1 transposase [Trichonephila clavipes]
MDNGRFQLPNDSGQPRTTVDQVDRLISRLAVTAPASSLSNNRRVTRRRVSTMTIQRRDESRFRLCPDDHRRHVWRYQGQYADFALTIARHTCSQPGVLACGINSFDSLTHVVIIKDTLTAQWYVDDILRNALLPFLLLFPGLIFQQDNAKRYTVRVAINCLTAL